MELWEQMVEFGKSWFYYPGLEWHLMLIAFGLALAFGAVWLLAHWPPLFKNRWLWVVGIFSAFFTLAAIIFIQIPLQYGINKGINAVFDSQTVQSWLLLIGLPLVLASGFVQEAAKIVPIIFWKRRAGGISPLMGMAIGALAGAGFGIFEAFYGIGSTLNAGWTTAAIQSDGFIGISPFWERFFTVAFHISVSAIAGYGVARGKAVMFYVIAALLHSLVNYSSIIYQYWFISTGGIFGGGHIAIVEMETYIAVIAVLVTGVAMLLRWSRRFHYPEEFLVDSPLETVATEASGESPAPTE